MQRGSRLGRGVAHAVVRPGTIQEAIDCLQACVDGDVCVIPQGANTGLTGASVPRDAPTKRGVVAAPEASLLLRLLVRPRHLLAAVQAPDAFAVLVAPGLGSHVLAEARSFWPFEHPNGPVEVRDQAYFFPHMSSTSGS